MCVCGRASLHVPAFACGCQGVVPIKGSLIRRVIVPKTLARLRLFASHILYTPYLGVVVQCDVSPHHLLGMPTQTLCDVRVRCKVAENDITVTCLRVRDRHTDGHFRAGMRVANEGCFDLQSSPVVGCHVVYASLILHNTDSK